MYDKVLRLPSAASQSPEPLAPLATIIPHILAHPGPVVVTTKPDVLPATAMARAQAGKLWCYCPDGVTDRIPAGAEELRWSPIHGARDWDAAIRTARTMAQVVDKESMRHGSHWQSRAADLLAPIFHWAVRSHRTMRDARDAVYAHASSLATIERWLRDDGASDAAAMLRSVIAAAEERASIGSTASAALAAYSTEAAMRTTDEENFDIADFINGGDGTVRADTIYINPMTRDQRELAPLIVGLLSQIQDAAYERHRALVRNGLTEHPGSGPILFALDELYGLAPMPDLPHLLSEGGSQSIHVTAAVQDLTLIKSRWPKEAASFMTLFGHVLFFPSIRDDAILEHVSRLLGRHDVEKRSETRKSTQTGGWMIKDYFAGREPQYGERVENVTYSTERRPRYDIDEVQTGPIPEDPDCAFHFYPGGWWEIVRLDPYYRGPTWPAALTAYFERALQGRVPEWRWWGRTSPAPTPGRTRLTRCPRFPCRRSTRGRGWRDMSNRRTGHGPGDSSSSSACVTRSSPRGLGRPGGRSTSRTRGCGASPTPTHASRGHGMVRRHSRNVRRRHRLPPWHGTRSRVPPHRRTGPHVVVRSCTRLARRRY